MHRNLISQKTNKNNANKGREPRHIINCSYDTRAYSLNGDFSSSFLHDDSTRNGITLMFLTIIPTEKNVNNKD